MDEPVPPGSREPDRGVAVADDAVTGVTAPGNQGGNMSERTSGRPPAPPGPGRLIGAGVVLTIAIVVPLLVWTYAKTTPELGGIPFFFWYQFLLVIGSVVLTWIAYKLAAAHDRDRRAAQGLGQGGRS